MFYLLIQALIFVSAILLFIKSRRSSEQFSWSRLTSGQRAALSLAFVPLIQLFIIPILPGWLIATAIVGYRDIHITPLESVVFGVIMILSNTLVYYFIFYFVIGWLSRLWAIRTGDGYAEVNSIFKD